MVLRLRDRQCPRRLRRCASLFWASTKPTARLSSCFHASRTGHHRERCNNGSIIAFDHLPGTAHALTVARCLYPICESKGPYGRCSQLLALQALIQTSKAFESATLQESANPARPITRQKSGSAATFTGPIHSPPTSYPLTIQSSPPNYSLHCHPPKLNPTNFRYCHDFTHLP